MKVYLQIKIIHFLILQKNMEIINIDILVKLIGGVFEHNTLRIANTLKEGSIQHI